MSIKRKIDDGESRLNKKTKSLGYDETKYTAITLSDGFMANINDMWIIKFLNQYEFWRIYIEKKDTIKCKLSLPVKSTVSYLPKMLVDQFMNTMTGILAIIIYNGEYYNLIVHSMDRDQVIENFSDFAIYKSLAIITGNPSVDHLDMIYTILNFGNSGNFTSRKNYNNFLTLYERK